MTARVKTRLVVRRGRIFMCSVGFVGLGFDRVKQRGVGEKIERVPVPVRSGRYSPVARIVRIRLRYWCSSWVGSWGPRGSGCNDDDDDGV